MEKKNRGGLIITNDKKDGLPINKFVYIAPLIYNWHMNLAKFLLAQLSTACKIKPFRDLFEAQLYCAVAHTRSRHIYKLTRARKLSLTFC